MFDVMLLLVEVGFEWVVVGVQTHFHVKPNSVEFSWSADIIAVQPVRVWKVYEQFLNLQYIPGVLKCTC